jgi:hypothetical protein
MPPTTITQKTPTALTPVAQKVIAGWTLVSGKTSVPTAIMQKPATGYTEVSQK